MSSFKMQSENRGNISKIDTLPHIYTADSPGIKLALQ